MAAPTNPNAEPNAFQRAAERLIFGNRIIVLLIFAAITLAMAFFASQLKVDAGFKKQIPLRHEYMKTFLDYEKDFGGANRILIAVMDKHGNMFNLPFFQTLQKVTTDAAKIDHADPSRISSIFTPGASISMIIMDCWVCRDWVGSVLPIRIATLQRGSPTPEDHHFRPLTMYLSP